MEPRRGRGGGARREGRLDVHVRRPRQRLPERRRRRRPSLSDADPGARRITAHGRARSSGAGIGRANVGWPENYGQQDASNNYLAIRIRSGMYPNILGFGVARKVGEDTTIKGYISIWSTVESLGYDKWAPINAEAREGYFNVTGSWGTVTVGRTLALAGSHVLRDRHRSTATASASVCRAPTRSGPPAVTSGPACSSPAMAPTSRTRRRARAACGCTWACSNPVVFSTSMNDWSHASTVRPEGALTFDRPIGMTSRIKFEVEGLVSAGIAHRDGRRRRFEPGHDGHLGRVGRHSHRGRAPAPRPQPASGARASGCSTRCNVRRRRRTIRHDSRAAHLHGWLRPGGPRLRQAPAQRRLRHEPASIRPPSTRSTAPSA